MNKHVVQTSLDYSRVEVGAEKYGISFISKGKEALEGKDHYVIEQTYPDGFKAIFYVDCKTYFITKSKGKISSEMGEMEFEQIPTDYKKVHGIVMAHTITTCTQRERKINSLDTLFSDCILFDCAASVLSFGNGILT